MVALGGHDNSIKDMIGSYAMGSLVEFIKRIPTIIISVIPFILYIVIIPFATFFFLLDDQHIKKYVVSLVPNRYFETTLNLLHSLNIQFGWLLRGMIITASIMSILISTGLWIIGFEYPILVGIFSGLANLIPYAGPVVGSVAAFIIALMTGSPNILFLYIILVFLIVNIIDNVLIQPMVLARVANLHPLFIIFLILLGSKLGGIFGMLLAIPVASLLRVTMKIIFKEISRPVKADFSQYKDIEDPSDETLISSTSTII